ncbi:MAG: DUF1186 domain-containing protein [Methylobacteriaceae bacterium]|nr:DUF1186 domain-containing protein [Methylobacteriaceae bacterium]
MSLPPDDIPRPRGVRPNLVEALSTAQHLPAEALDHAVTAPERVADAVLAAARRAAAGETLDERDGNLLFWGAHVMGAARDARLCAPLFALLTRVDGTGADLFGDIALTMLPRLVASIFDGDRAALEGAIAAADADETIRWALWGAYTSLAVAGRIDREAAIAFVDRFDRERLARAGEEAWLGWADAIALLGLGDRADRVAAAVAEARLLEDQFDPDAFRATLAAAAARPDDLAPCAEMGLGLIEDVVAELDEALAALEDDEGGDETPLRNPLRDVGRNDPCPCGSGRKYKKCCLTAASAGGP